MKAAHAVARPHEEPTPVPIPSPAPKRKYRTRGQGGSVYPRGKSWIAMYRNAEGRQQCKTFHSKAEARHHLTEVLQAIRENKPVGVKPELFSVFAERWLDSRLPSLKPNTHKTYRTSLNKWLLPAFGKTEMRDITRAEVEMFKDHLLRKHLAGKSARMLVILLREICDAAIDAGLATWNPVPRIKKLHIPKGAKKRYMPEPADVLATIARLNDNPAMQVLLVAAGMTGLRRGELLGLFWSEIDWHKAIIKVERSLTRAKQAECDGKFYDIEWVRSTEFALVLPKSATSVRMVALRPELADLLRWLRALAPDASSPYVFQAEDGGPLSPDGTRYVLREAQVAAGVKPFGLHGLRHLFVSSLLASGAPLPNVRDRAGHSSIAVTDRYAHGLGKKDAEYAAEVALLFPNVIDLLSNRALDAPAKEQSVEPKRLAAACT